MVNTNGASPKENIVIIGGSYGGVSTAHYLLKHAIPVLPNPSSYQIILISASDQVFCRPASPRALISDDLLPQDKLFVGIPGLFEKYGNERFQFMYGTAMNVDVDKRTVEVDLANDGGSGSIDFHALVVATGTSTISPLLGLNRDVKYLRDSWSAFRAKLPAAKSIIVVGGGPTGIETAGELGEYLNGHAGWFSSKLASPKVFITVVTSAERILPILRPAIAKTAEDYLAKVGVTVVKGARVVSVSPEGAGTDDVGGKARLTLDKGNIMEADLYIPATGTKPNTSFMPQALLDASGRIKTNPSTLRIDSSAKHSLLYAIGDAASSFRPAIHLTIEAIPVLCANIKRDLLLDAGSKAEEALVKAEREYKEDLRETQLVPIGKSKGVGAAMGWRVPSFMVWAIKGRDYWLWTTGGLWSGKQWDKET